MNLDYTETQTLLRDTLRRFLADRYSFAQRQAMLQSAQGRDPAIWQALATDLGMPGAALPQAHGGFGGGPLETMLLMEELGQAIAVEPWVPTLVIGAQALLETAATALLSGIIAGDVLIAAGFHEPQGRYHPADVQTTARREAGRWVLNGHKPVVIAAPYATHFLVTARTAGSQRDTDGISLFLLPADTPGIMRRDYPCVDGYLAAELDFENVAVTPDALLGTEGSALPLVEKLLDHATVATCAEAVGAMRRLHALTLDYAKERRQFGQPIGSFQVIQHRLADMFMEVEQAASMVLMATLRLDDAERAKWVSQCKARVNKAARFVGQSAVQIHGGIGITQELAAGHYFMRLSIIETRFGDLDWHLGRLEEGLAAEAA